MTGSLAIEPLVVSEASAPMLPRHVKLRHDKNRDKWVMLAPERVLVPDETALAIVQLCDGERTVGAIADDLAAKYNAPRDVIVKDVIAMLQDLADKGFVTN